MGPRTYERSGPTGRVQIGSFRVVNWTLICPMSITAQVQVWDGEGIDRLVFWRFPELADHVYYVWWEKTKNQD